MYKAAILLFPALLLLSASAACAQSVTSTSSQDITPVVHTIESALKAIKADNQDAFDHELSPGFYMFDDGHRFTASSLMALIKSVHASGTQIDWRVLNPEVHITGDTAWISYLNDATITSKTGTVGRKFLESAFLIQSSDGWKISFWHSSPAQDTPSPQ